MVVHLGLEAHVFQGQAHRRTDVVQRIDRRNREVAAFDGRAVPCVSFLDAAIGVPGAFVRVDLVEAALHRVVPRGVIENEELILGTEVCRIGNARCLQVSLGALRQRPGTAIVTLHRRRFDDIATQIERRLIREHVEHGR